jgi:hypothetical protein
MLMAGLGAAAAVTLAPLAAGVAQAAQLKLTPATFPTMTTTVVTNGTWQSATGKTHKVLVEHAYPTYTTAITGATWIWATLGQAAYTATNGGPGSVAAGTVTLSTTFTVPGNPQASTLTLAADNGATVLINGTTVAALSPNATQTNFDAPHHFTIPSTDLVAGMNTITIVGTNVTYPGYNPAAVIAKLTATSTLSTINLCKHTGWKQWTTPTFSNQGDCVAYLVGNGNDPTIPNIAQS